MGITAWELTLSAIGTAALMVLGGLLFRGSAFQAEAATIGFLLGMALTSIYSQRRALADGRQEGRTKDVLIAIGASALLMLVGSFLFRNTAYQAVARVTGMLVGFAIVSFVVSRRTRTGSEV